MKKLICLTVFLTALFAYSANAQSINDSPNIKNEVETKAKTFMLHNPKASIEELKANLVDEYGIKDMKLVKDANGNYSKEESLKAYEKKNVSELDTYTIIIILAIIGAIAVILLIFK